MKTLNVWLVQTGEPLPVDNDIRKMRTALLADKLIEREHSVVWWSSAFDHFTKEWLFKRDSEIILRDRYRIIALKGKGYTRNISVSRFIDHRIIARKFKKKASELPKPDIIVSSLPPHDLSCQVAVYAKKNKIPLLVDIRDPWPDIFLNHVPSRLKSIVRFLLKSDFKMTEKTMQSADGLIAVNKTFLEWGLIYANRDKTSKDKVYYLGAKKQEIPKEHDIPENLLYLADSLNNKYLIFFVGTLSSSYHNPSILLKVAEKLIGNTNIHFVIAGDGELLANLKSLSSHLTNVTLTGWLNHKEISFLLAHSKIGVCPVTESVDLPTNKVFSYLSAGLPIISAFQGDVKEIIENHRVGFYYPPNDVEALVNCIKKLYSDAALYNKMSDNARKLFDAVFDADKIYDDYAAHIEKVANDDTPTE